ncbi:uncharacterized protein [Acropora muricata]|uniref:uncharacterized protein isoform X2 n=1 Tax=Acropora muricata TaxID=159855 RepID=UPI0034E492FA
MAGKQSIQSKKTTKKLLRKLSPHKGARGDLHKASPQKNERGQKKNAVQPSHEQVAAMQNPESLQPSDAEVLNNLQNYNKHYINNEMAAETALLADNGIDDDSALKISNMVALPHGMPKGANAFIKAKISNSQHADEDESADHSRTPSSPGGYDPNAYLYDANSWPEYAIHDSDYSNFNTVEMNNMNGENTDMPPMYNRPQQVGPQSTGKEGGTENPASQGLPQNNQADATSNDNEKIATGVPLMHSPNDAKNTENSSGGKPAADSEAKGASQAQTTAKPAAGVSQDTAQKNEKNSPASSDPASKTQEKQEDNGSAGKLEASVVKAAASLPPKAIASLVKSLVGSRKAAAAASGRGQVQKYIAGTISDSPVPENFKPASELTQSPTLLHKVAKPKKN